MNDTMLATIDLFLGIAVLLTALRLALFGWRD